MYCPRCSELTNLLRRIGPHCGEPKLDSHGWDQPLYDLVERCSHIHKGRNMSLCQLGFRFISVISLIWLNACSTYKPNFNPYEGLLPANYKMVEAPQRLNPVELKKKFVVVVASTEFEDYVKQYAEFYEGSAGGMQKGFMKALTTVTAVANPLASTISGVGDTDSLFDATRKAQDPRVIIENVSIELVKAFGKVGTASDFADAQDQKADYILLADYYWKPNTMGTEFTGVASTHLLDRDLRRLFVVEATAVEPRYGISAVDAFQRIHASLTQKLRNGLRTQFSSSQQ